MIAVIKIGGHQVIVESGEIIRVDNLKDLEVGQTLDVDVLMISEPDGKGFKVGTPTLPQKATVKVLEHGRDKKIKVFKMKPRKRYSKTYGHRQDFTVVEILTIDGTINTTKKTDPAAETEIKEAVEIKETKETSVKNSEK